MKGKMILPLSKYQWNNRFRVKARFKCIEAYGGKCACCGEKRAFLLCIDHIKNDGAKERRYAAKTLIPGRRTLKGGAGTPFFLSLIKRGFPNKDKYQVLCFNCNALKERREKCNCKELPWTATEVIKILESYKPQIPQGEEKVMSKLKNKDIVKIRKLYKEGTMNQPQIAKFFHIHPSGISRIINRKIWRHI